jgi:C-terminal processing protease CtpA/Prc
MMRGLALLTIVALAMSAVGKAPEEVKEPKDVSAALKMIGSDEFNRREVATDYLMRAPSDALSQVEKRLEKERDPEAIERLSRVALHLFMKDKTVFEGKVGFLGIAFKGDKEYRGKYGDEPRPVVWVLELLPGFPSNEHLKIGDCIVGIAGTEFPEEFTDNDFRDLILNKKPGTKVTLMVERGKDRFNVSIPLAGIKDLDVMSMPTYKGVRESMAASYLSSLKHAGDKPIEVPIENDFRSGWNTNADGNGWSTGGGWDVKGLGEDSDRAVFPNKANGK